MPRSLKTYEWPGCCKGFILSGLGADSDDCMPRDFEEVRKELEHAEKRRQPMRGFTAVVLTRSQAHYYKSLLKEFGYKRVSSWFDWLPDVCNPIAIFVARHRSRGYEGELDTRNLSNRAKGGSFN